MSRFNNKKLKYVILTKLHNDTTSARLRNLVSRFIIDSATQMKT